MTHEKIQKAISILDGFSSKAHTIQERHDALGVLISVANEYLEITNGWPLLADGKHLRWNQKYVYHNGEECRVSKDLLGRLVAVSSVSDDPDETIEYELNQCWSTIEESTAKPLGENK